MPSKTGIEIKTMRISCQSDNWLDTTKSYQGIIVYNIGTFDAKGVTGNNIFPGYILIKEDKKIQENPQDLVKAGLEYSLFKMEPSQMVSQHGAKFSAFTIDVGGNVKLNSKTLYGDSWKETHEIFSQQQNEETRLI